MNREVTVPNILGEVTGGEKLLLLDHLLIYECRVARVRIKDLLLRHGRTAWRLWCRDEEMVTLAKRENALTEWLASP